MGALSYRLKLIISITASLVIALSLVISFRIDSTKVTLPPGEFAPLPPKQRDYMRSKPFTVRDNYLLTPRAEFTIQAKVLSSKKYSDTWADLMPLDLALGWGPMSNQTTVDLVQVNQNKRWYFYNTSSAQLSISDVAIHSSNIHLIPSNETLKKKAMDFRVGEVVELKGHLVDIKDLTTRNSMSTSMSRTDTLGGACEIFYVTYAKVLYSTRPQQT